MDLLNGMLQKDQDEFRRICNKLINVCFICRQNQATKSDTKKSLKNYWECLVTD